MLQEVEAGERLLQAAKRRDWAEVKALLAAGAPTTAADEDGTALHYAVEAGALDTVKLLLLLGADPKAECWRGSPLTCAFFDQYYEPKPEHDIDLEIIQALVTVGVDPNRGNIYDCAHFPGYTLMHVAALENADYIIKALIDIGANMEVRAA